MQPETSKTAPMLIDGYDNAREARSETVRQVVYIHSNRSVEHTRRMVATALLVVRALGDVRADEAEVRLPASLRDVLKADQGKVFEQNAVPRTTDDPSRIRFFLKNLAVHFLNESLNRACHILRHLRARDRARRVLEVAGGNLTGPRRIASGPLYAGSATVELQRGKNER